MVKRSESCDCLCMNTSVTPCSILVIPMEINAAMVHILYLSESGGDEGQPCQGAARNGGTQRTTQGGVLSLLGQHHIVVYVV